MVRRFEDAPNHKPEEEFFLKGYNLKCLRNKPEKKYCYGFTVI